MWYFSVYCSPYTDGNAVFNYIFMLIFFVDSCLSFRVAIIENDILITDAQEIAKTYLRSAFVVTLLLTHPSSACPMPLVLSLTITTCLC